MGSVPEFLRPATTFINVFSRDGGANFFAVGSIVPRVEDKHIDIAAQDARLGKGTRINIIGSAITSVTFEPPISAEKAEAFALSMAEQLRIQVVREIAVAQPGQETVHLREIRIR